jgi:predicted nuclease with TOPRIM domain
MTIDQQFTIINEKLQQLLKQYSRLQKETERLRYEVSDLKKKESLVAQKMEEMQEQITILKVASGELSEKDKKDFERKINKYIREVDKCITFLSQ